MNIKIRLRRTALSLAFVLSFPAVFISFAAASTPEPSTPSGAVLSISEYEKYTQDILDEAIRLYEENGKTFLRIRDEALPPEQVRDLFDDLKNNLTKAKEMLWDAAVAADLVNVESENDGNIILTAQKKLFRLDGDMTYEYVAVMKPEILARLKTAGVDIPEPAGDAGVEDTEPADSSGTITAESTVTFATDENAATETDTTVEPVPVEDAAPEEPPVEEPPAVEPEKIDKCRLAETEYNETRRREDEICADTIQVLKDSDCYRAMNETIAAQEKFRSACGLAGGR